MVALIYFPSFNKTSIIDETMLNFCIRNGNRCFHSLHQYHRLCIQIFTFFWTLLYSFPYEKQVKFRFKIITII